MKRIRHAVLLISSDETQRELGVRLKALKDHKSAIIENPVDEEYRNNLPFLITGVGYWMGIGDINRYLSNFEGKQARRKRFNIAA